MLVAGADFRGVREWAAVGAEAEGGALITLCALIEVARTRQKNARDTRNSPSMLSSLHTPTSPKNGNAGLV
jgi:hypothetical protein